MIKKITKSLLMGILTVSASTGIARGEFPMKQIGMNLENNYHQNNQAPSEFTSRSGLCEIIMDQKNKLINDQTQLLNKIKADIKEGVNTINHLIDELRQAKEDLRIYKQDIVKVKSLLKNKNNEIEVLKKVNEEVMLKNELLSKEHNQLLQLLSLVGININDLDVLALINAAGQGDLQNVKALLEAGVSPKSDDSKALIVAASGGYFEVVKLLIKAGADPRAQYSQALFNAYWNGHAEISNFLYDSGADPVIANRLQKFLSIFFDEKDQTSL